MDRKTQMAVARYGEQSCRLAFQLNTQGWGPSSIALQCLLTNVHTTGQANAAINAGRELARDDEEVRLESLRTSRDCPHFD